MGIFAFGLHRMKNIWLANPVMAVRQQIWWEHRFYPYLLGSCSNLLNLRNINKNRKLAAIDKKVSFLECID